MMWLNEYQVDGIRFDSCGCIRLRQGSCGTFCCGSDIGVGRNFGWELMQGINNRIDATQSWKLTIAEDLNDNAAITNATSSGGAGFDAQWDTDLQAPSSTRSLSPMTAESTSAPSRTRCSIHRKATRSSGSSISNRTTKPMARACRQKFFQAIRKTGTRKKSILGFAVVLTTPGIPMFFQGAELLDGRTWNPGGSSPTMMDFTRRQKFPKLFQFYCEMIRLRTQSPGLTGDGVNVFQANPATKVLAYHRWNQGSGADDLVIVANFSGTSFPTYTIGFPYQGTWHVRLNSDANAYSDANDFGSVNSYDTQASPGGWDGMPYAGNVGIGPYSIIVLSL